MKNLISFLGLALIICLCSFEYNPVPIFNNAPNRALNTAYRPVAARATVCSYTITVTQSVSLLNSSADGRVFFDISPDNVTWTNIQGAGATKTLSVSITVGLNEVLVYNLNGSIPKGYYGRIRTTLAGGATAVMTSGQEIMF